MKTRREVPMIRGKLHPDILAWHAQFVAPAHVVNADYNALLQEADCERWRKDPSVRVGVTAGCMDVTHVGHDLVFEEAKLYCDVLLVMLQTDPTFDRKEKNKPVQPLHARFTQVRTHRAVDKIYIYDQEAELYCFLQNHARANGGFIDVRIIGSDYKGKRFTGDDLPIKLYYNWRRHEYSSTNLRNEVYEAERIRRLGVGRVGLYSLDGGKSDSPTAA